MSESPQSPSGKPLKAADLARHWGCSRTYAGKKVKEGCPLTSLEDADAWREANSKYGTGYRSKGSGTAEEKPPDTSSTPNEKIPRENAPNEKRDAKIQSLEELLKRASEIEDAAYQDVMGEKNPAIKPHRIAAYNKARDGRLQAEEMIQKLQEKQSILVPMDVAREACRNVMIPLINRLRSFAKAIAPEANPTDYLHAESVIDQGILNLTKDVIKELRIPQAA